MSTLIQLRVTALPYVCVLTFYMLFYRIDHLTRKIQYVDEEVRNQKQCLFQMHWWKNEKTFILNICVFYIPILCKKWKETCSQLDTKLPESWLTKNLMWVGECLQPLTTFANSNDISPSNWFDSTDLWKTWPPMIFSIDIWCWITRVQF